MPSAARVAAADGLLIADGPGRAAPDVERRVRAPKRRQGGPDVVRRNGQRRRAGDRLRRPSRAPSVARRGGRGPHGPRAGPGLGPPSRRARRLQQPRLGDVRGAAGRDRRSGRAAAGGPGADGRSQAVQPGGRRRRADLAVGVCAADAARARRQARRPLAVARGPDRRHERARPPAAAAHIGTGACWSRSRSSP